MLIDEYLASVEKHKIKYGDKCVVLMQVGSFYELYSIIDEPEEDIYKIADICNIQVARKNKAVKEASINNHLMLGFPLHAIKKFTNILLSHCYTIVIIEQVTEPPNPERKITEILSPGMNMNVTEKRTNFIMVLCYEYIDNMPTVGIAGIDMTTGSSFVFETGSTRTDPELTNDEVYRIMTIYNPCEIVILSNGRLSDEQKNYLTKGLHLGATLAHKKWDTYEYLDVMKKPSYQATILEKAFERAFENKKSFLSIIDALDLERHHTGRIALCCLLQFSYEHNVDIIKRITPPEVIDNERYLNIEYNSSLQLNLVGSGTDKHLVSILDRCSTQFGSRVFRERLLKPIIDKEELKKRYDSVEYLMKEGRFRDVSKLLGKILDLERIKRKMLVCKINPSEWSGFYASIENAIEVIDTYYKDIDTGTFKDMIQHFTNVLDIEEASKYSICDIKGNIFKEGVYPEIDEEERQHKEAYNSIASIVEQINNLDRCGDTTSCKIDYNEREGYFIGITKKRLDNAKKIDKQFMSGFQVKSIGTSNNVRLISHEISSHSNTIDEKRLIITKKVLVFYREFVEEFIGRHNESLSALIRTITDIDISNCNARNAFEFRYYRPVIEDSDASFIRADSIRHPIIERINDDAPYICNDIELSNERSNGLLLYGINSSGKSCLMKAIGLNIVMAQAGMFVASSCMTFYPYKHIFTRISGMDNIYKGMSSFIVEMTELRNILQRSNKHSLVLGDEVCSGTEATSAIAIVASGIDCLVKKRASFIFATHLHELTDIEIVKMHTGHYIAVKHIHIVIGDNNRIIYERKLKDGRGHSTYGIEVCRSLDMPPEFMRIAEEVRRETEGMNRLLVQPTRSRYNSELLMGECSVCGGRAVDTHHIKYQCDSDVDGYFADHHKNAKHNLVPLCKECHNKEHNGGLSIKGYKGTSHGIVLEYTSMTSMTSMGSMGSAESIASTCSDTDSTPSDENPVHFDMSHLKMYVKRGKLHWYVRGTKTSAFKVCKDELKVQEKICKILKKDVSISDNDYICNSLFDPSY